MKEQNRYKKRYKVAIYCRLSKDDDIRVGESSSIQSQKEMIEKYVIENGWDIQGYYIDDGYSGTNFNRPDFERMIDDIEYGKVDCVITKDLSRLGRNYIQTGEYTEIYFPAKGVRYIALNDGVDTLNIDNDIAPFKNILNEFYSRDMSKKIRSAVKAQKEKGKYLSNYAPIGYQKDPKDKNKLIVEETGAAVVKRIFEMSVADMGSVRISKVLTDEGIPTPVNHRKWLLHGTPPVPTRWNHESVSAILRNRTYVGDTVQGIYDCARFKRTPSKRKPKDEWIITPGTHEPLVSLETWELIQNKIDARFRPMKKGEVHLFAGFLKCQDCGYALSYSDRYNIAHYICSTARQYGKSFCSSHYIRMDTLESILLEDIRKYSMLAESKEDELAKQLCEQHGDDSTAKIKVLNKELIKLNNRNVELDNILKRLYEDNVSGKLPDDMFSKYLTEYRKEQFDVQVKIGDTEKEICQVKKAQRDTSSWIELIRNYTKIERIDRTVLNELVEKITVGEAKLVDGQKTVDVTIHYRFIGSVA